MSTKSIMEKIDEQERLDTAGAAIQPVILDAFKAGGKTGKDIKNMLHGKWLDHPVHPMITDVPVGAWTTAAVLDAMELFGNDKYKDGADAAVSIGLVGAAGAAITGMTDWTGTTEIERKAGLLHGLLNVGATALYIASLIMRRKKSSRRAAITFANTCSHLGGPLSEGELLNDCRVRCPWHQSVFSLKDSSVIDGPATEPQPEFDVRVKDGQIEVRIKK